MRIGLLSALPSEMEKLKGDMLIAEKKLIANRTYHLGTLYGHNTVLVRSNTGKIAASITTSILIHEFKVDVIVFTGIAGAISPELSIGDIVVGDKYLQYDMDMRPLFEQYIIPQLDCKYIYSDDNLVKKAAKASEKFLTNIHKKISLELLSEFNLTKPKIFVGTISSRDQFVSDLNEKKQMYKTVPDTLCIEMEGASVAQVCYEFNIPFIVIRTISDHAEGHALKEIKKFNQFISSSYSTGIIANLYEML